MKMKITARAARVNAGYKQTDIAKMLNITTRTLQKWERGDGNISAKNLMKLCEIYKIPMDCIILP